MKIVALPGWRLQLDGRSQPKNLSLMNSLWLQEVRWAVQVEGEKIIVKRGHSLLVRGGSRVRYSNPYDQHAEYWSVCIPPFSLSTVHRE